MPQYPSWLIGHGQLFVLSISSLIMPIWLQTKSPHFYFFYEKWYNSVQRDSQNLFEMLVDHARPLLVSLDVYGVFVSRVWVEEW